LPICRTPGRPPGELHRARRPRPAVPDPYAAAHRAGRRGPPAGPPRGRARPARPCQRGARGHRSDPAGRVGGAARAVRPRGRAGRRGAVLRTGRRGARPGVGPCRRRAPAHVRRGGAGMSSARAPLARTLALVPYLQRREAVPLEEVARDLGVSADQVVRDLNVLWFCGLPGLGMGDLIEVDMDALDGEGVVRVSNADYLSRPLRLRADEASALLVALQTLRATTPADQHGVIDSVIGKIAAAAEDGGAHADQVAVQVADAGAEVEVRDRLERALADRRQVRLTYHVPSRDEVTERVVDPLGLLVHDGRAYLRAWCHLAGGERRFRLDRVRAAVVLGSTVSSPRPDAGASPAEL